MDKNELLNKLKMKCLVVGDSGVGKTYFCVKVAENVAKEDGKILYLDVDDGAILELLNLDDSVLSNIEHRNIVDFEMLRDTLKKEPNNYDLIVIDILYPYIRDWVRLYAKSLFLKQGYYYLGEKKVRIENPETFDLRGFMYSLPNSFEKEIFLLLRRANCNIIATAYPIESSDKRNEVYGFFDVVFSIYQTSKDRYVNVIKCRGNKKLEERIKEDYIKAISDLVLKKL